MWTFEQHYICIRTTKYATESVQNYIGDEQHEKMALTIEPL